ncbi:MAG: RCC1 domain-containing protein [Myxococcota bacterium]
MGDTGALRTSPLDFPFSFHPFFFHPFLRLPWTMLVIGMSTGACGNDTSAWRVSFESVIDREQSTIVEAVVLRESCNNRDPVIGYELRRDVPLAPDSIQLEAGPFGLLGIARDDQCTVIAEACQDVELPSGDPLVLRLVTQGDRVYGCAGRVCEAGSCAEGNGIDTCSLGGQLPALAVGPRSGCGLSGECQAFCWGTTTAEGPSLAPTPVAVAGRLQQVAVGADHACILRNDGTLFCSGRGDEGQLGRGNVASDSRFGAVEGSFSMVAAAVRYTCGLTRDGSILCWGEGGPWIGTNENTSLAEISGSVPGLVG